MMKYKISSVLQPAVLFILILLSGVAFANSNGAGGCDGGQAAVGGYHLDDSNDRTVISADLALGKVSVTIDDDLLEPDGSAYTIQTQTDYTVTVTTENEAGFKGVLYRLEAPDGVDTTGALEAINSDLQLANVCQAPVVGVTHTDNNSKMSVSARLRMDEPADYVVLEITVVGVNSVEGSVYGYNGFGLSVQGEAAPKTPSPTLPPGKTFSPTLAPTVTDVLGTLSPTPSGVIGSTILGQVLVLAAFSGFILLF